MRNSLPSRPALSASRTKEYQRCPLQFRLHVVDRVKEPPTQATLLGTTVHSTLENLYALPREERNETLARELLRTEWEKTLAGDPSVMNLFTDRADFERWHERMYSMISSYFAIEDPQALEPLSTEALVEATTSQGVNLLGYIDRVDQAPNGDLRVIDYKTGKAPGPRYVEEALYQLRFYALLLARTQVLPSRMQLVYLKAGQVITFDPEAGDIANFERHIDQLWDSIARDIENDSFTPRKNPLCNWCGVRTLCPVFGGTTPPLPEQHARWLSRTRLG